MAMVFLADNGPDFLDFTPFPRSKCPNVLGLDSPQYELVFPIFSYLSDHRLWRNKMISPFLPLKPVTVLGPYWDHSFLTSFSSIRCRHSPRCASPFDVSQPIWVYSVVHTMLLPCLGSPADAVRLFPSWYGSRVEPFFPL
jgi:hypothetical protein